jgi:hypothetical protein
MLRLQAILRESDVEKVCENLQSYFRDILERREDPKELLSQFPNFVNKLFVDGSETL